MVECGCMGFKQGSSHCQRCGERLHILPPISVDVDSDACGNTCDGNSQSAGWPHYCATSGCTYAETCCPRGGAPHDDSCEYDWALYKSRRWN